MVKISDRKIKQVLFHAAVTIGNMPTNSARVPKDGVTGIEFTDKDAVLIKSMNHKKEYCEDIVPFSDILTIKLFPEDDAEQEAEIAVSKKSKLKAVG
jgi:hypothetical protein